jgi:hypothetical protein
MSHDPYSVRGQLIPNPWRMRLTEAASTENHRRW